MFTKQSHAVLLMLVVSGAVCIPGRNATVGSEGSASGSSGVVDRPKQNQASFKEGGVVRPFGGGGTFLFPGTAGQSYVLLSAPAEGYQVTTTVHQPAGATASPAGSKENSNIYMESVNFMYQNMHLHVQAAGADSAQVYLDGEELKAGETWTYETRRELDAGNAPITIQFKHFVPEHGTVINITADVVHLFVTIVPATTTGEANAHPTYLNIDVDLLEAPAAKLEGIIGETYGWNSAMTDPNGEKMQLAVYPHEHFPTKPAQDYEIPKEAIPTPSMIRFAANKTALSRRMLR
eukprot:jgi/Botrbrau1/3069/Bobra.0070s0062.1